MPFPVSPTVGQTTVTNNITYIYSTASNFVGYWTRVLSTGTSSSSGGTKSTTTSSAPANATVGDIWYYQGTDAVYRFEYDGTTSTWIDITGPTSSGGGGGGSFTGGTVPASVQIQSSLSVATTVLVGTITTTATQVGLIVGTTDAIAVPIGTTAQRPANR